MNNEILKKLKENLGKYDGTPIKIMEVCGTHTMSIFKHGIKSLLSDKIKLISGPGCPVCVTPQDYIDNTIEILKDENIILATFGDMLRVPGTKSTLEKSRAMGKDIRIVYSPLDCLKICIDNPDKKIVFLAVGFETTAPVIALSITKAMNLDIKNFYIYCGMKTIIPALQSLCDDKDLSIDGFLLPGHVSAIIGQGQYEFLVAKYKKACVIAGFEGDDIIIALNMLIKQIISQKKSIENAYTRVVNATGNSMAHDKIFEVFELQDCEWRGMGILHNSGLAFNEKYNKFNVENIVEIKRYKTPKIDKCLCGEVIKGKKNPNECELFYHKCNPGNPLGPCMVSGEGICAAYYKYRV